MTTRTPAEEAIIRARVQMLLKTPFFGTLATRLELVDASNWLPTLATDGRRFYYNADFVLSLKPKELEFGVAHEVMHCVYQHIERRGNRDPRIWNIASDYVINLELTDCGFEKITTVQILHDEKYRDMTSDEVYDLIMEDIKKNQEMSKFSESGGGSGEPLDSFDKHLEPGQSGKDQDGDESGKNGPVPMTQEEWDQLSDEIKQAVIDAAKQVDPSHGRGMPGRIKRYIKNLTDPKVPWNEILNKNLVASFPNDFTWERPNRKTMSQGIYLPSTKREHSMQCVIGIDTSGSITENIFRDFLSEVKGIMEQFSSYEIFFFCWDSTCYTLHRFDETNGDDLIYTEFEGGGGNNGIDFVLKYIEDNDLKPDHFVNFTDGYIFGPWGEEPDYPVTHVIWTHNKDGSVEENLCCPYGQNIIYNCNDVRR